MDNTFKWIAGFAVASALANYIAVYSVYKNTHWISKFKNYLLCFAAGVLISTPLLIAFPEAFEKDKNAGVFGLLGFLFMFFVDKMINHFTNRKEVAFGITGAIAIGFHSFVDGIIYTITFSASIMIGILSATGLVAHEFAEGVITYTFLIAGGFNNKKAFIYAFLIAGLTTPIGAFVVYPLVSKLSGEIIPLLLGFVGGILIYFSASHLIPEANENNEHHSFIALLSGVVFVVLLVMVGGG